MGPGKQISDFRVFRSPTAAPSGTQGAWDRLPHRQRVGKETAAAKIPPDDFPDDFATSESLCDTQDSFWQESEVQGKQISVIQDFR